MSCRPSSTRNLRRIIDDAIENDVRRGREGMLPRAQLVSGASRKRMFFDQRDHFGDFAEYLFCGMAAGDPDVVIPNPFAVSESLRRPERHAPGLGHLPILLSDEIVDAGLSSLSCIERTDALVDFRAQCSQLLDVREQGPSDLFLILGGQPLYLGNGLFECFDHNHIIPDRTTQVRGRQRLAARKSPCCRMATPRRAHSKALAAALLHDACFRPFSGQYTLREVGGGRATRQPGQIRKEAALTSAVRVARQPPTLLRIGRSFALTLRCEPTGPARSGRHDGKLREPRRVVASHRPSRLGRIAASHLRTRPSKMRQ